MISKADYINQRIAEAVNEILDTAPYEYDHVLKVREWIDTYGDIQAAITDEHIDIVLRDQNLNKGDSEAVTREIERIVAGDPCSDATPSEGERR